MQRYWWLGFAVLLVACGGAMATPTVDPAPTQTRAVELAQLATLTAPTAAPTPAPPTATEIPPTATATAAPPTATATVPPTPVPAPTPISPPPTVVVGAPWAEGFSPYQVEGAYQRPEGRLYGRRAVTLYGTGSGFDQGVWTFTAETLPDVPLVMSFIGLDDSLPEHTNLQVLLNGVTVFAGPNTFPNVPDDDNGEGGADRYWARMSIPIPAATLKIGPNTLTLRNTSPWQGALGNPYLLINDLDFAVER